MNEHMSMIQYLPQVLSHVLGRDLVERWPSFVLRASFPPYDSCTSWAQHLHAAAAVHPGCNAVRAGHCGHRSNASYDGQNGEVMQAGGKARNTMVVGVDEAAGKLP